MFKSEAMASKLLFFFHSNNLIFKNTICQYFSIRVSLEENYFFIKKLQKHFSNLWSFLSIFIFSLIVQKRQ